MNEMQRMFEAIYDLAKRKGNLEEAMLYTGGRYASIDYVVDGVTYSVSITKREDKKDA